MDTFNSYRLSTYNIPMTVVSLLAAAAVTGLGLAVAAYYPGRAGSALGHYGEA